jgi:ABC-type Na+ efflux pump permease subunit
MTFLPVVERELRVAARRRATPLVRVAAATVALGVTLWVLAVDRRPLQVIGSDLFAVLAALLFIYAGILGTQVTADCMSQEKRDGTFGLLFLTDLKGYDVVLGKLTAAALPWFYGMLAVGPVLAIPILLGGVSYGEFLRVALVSLNLLFFSLCAGLWASTICRRSSLAHALSLLTALTIMFAWPAAAQLYPHLGLKNSLLSSPAYGCALAFDKLSTPQKQSEFWINALMTQFFSWSLLGLACWLAPRCWQETAVARPWSWRWLRSTLSRQRARLLTLNPVLWRASRSIAGAGLIWLMLGALAALWLCQDQVLRPRLPARVFSGVYFDPAIDIAFLIVAGLFIKAWVAAESGRALGEERRSGSLELLLTTPMRPQDILRGQQLALWQKFVAPIVALVSANLFCLIVEWQDMLRRGTSNDERNTVIWIHIVVAGFLVLDSIALSWVGMWHGFVAHKSGRAAFPAMLRIVVLPGLPFLVLISIFLTLGAGLGGVDALACWCALGACTDIFAFVYSDKLLEEFRKIASEGYNREAFAKTRSETACLATMEVS